VGGRGRGPPSSNAQSDQLSPPHCTQSYLVPNGGGGFGLARGAHEGHPVATQPVCRHIPYGKHTYPTSRPTPVPPINRRRYIPMPVKEVKAKSGQHLKGKRSSRGISNEGSGKVAKGMKEGGGGGRRHEGKEGGTIDEKKEGGDNSKKSVGVEST